MDSGRWARLKEVFAHAIELSPELRVSYVAEACGGDSKLRAGVERLLKEHVEAESGHIFSSDRWSVRRQPSLDSGSVVGGRYRIVGFLGSGGMGEVYKVEDMPDGRILALKMLRPELAGNAQFVARFRREAQLARHVTHRNLCRILDVGREPRAFLTMEFLDGQSLGERIRERGAMPPRDALPIVEGIAAGLQALHGKGIVHRDIKPGNVILVGNESEAERAVLGDFGAAVGESLVGSSLASITKPGNVLGTPEYMAPEQLAGKRMTPAADIYSFGLIIYELVTGRRPFSGGVGLENAARRLSEDPVPPKSWAPELSQVWEETILWCLEREAAKRPHGAALVAEKLRVAR